jgi:hypothetical protein
MPACGTLGFYGPSSAWCLERRVVVGEPDVVREVGGDEGAKRLGIVTSWP